MIVLLAGLQAVGKTTAGRLLAQRYERGAYVEGDLFYLMVVAGRADMTPDPSPEALRQLALRYRASARTAAAFAEEGFVAVVAHVIGAEDVPQFAAAAAPHDVRVVWLDATDDEIAARERARGSRAYDDWLGADGDLVAAVARLRTQVGGPPAGAVVVDTTGRTPDETADEVRALLG